MQIYRTIALHVRLIASVHDAQWGGFVKPLKESKAYLREYQQMQQLMEEIGQARKRCWANGFDLTEVDQILGSGYDHESYDSVGLHNQHYEQREADLTALRNRLAHLRHTRSSKQDRINSWLLPNLAASDEGAALHRSFLPDPEAYNEKEWARQVLKFWPLDGAAIKGERGAESSHGLVRSGRAYHSVKVLLDMMDLEELNVATSASAVSDGHRFSRILDHGAL